MNTEITDYQRSLSRKYISYRVLTNLWFVGAVWLYFYRLFMTDHQVGVLDGMAFAIGMLAEVPSGALADKFGRDKMVRLGQILAGAGMLIHACASSFAVIFLAQTTIMIGVSFVSGADEALFFKKLNFDRKSVNWRKLVTRGSQFALIGTLFATVAGGWLHTINPRIPWILTGIAFISSALIIWPIKEIQPEKSNNNLLEELRDYIANIKLGFMQFGTPKLWLYVPIIITVQGLFYTAGWGLLRLVLLDRFHFDPFWGSVVIASSSLITVGMLAVIHKHAEKISEKRMICLISFGAVASLLLSMANIGVWGYFVILALYSGEHILYPFMSEALNNRATEKQRATVLSVASFIRTLPYVILAPIIGYLNTTGSLEYFFVGWAILICLAVVLYLLLKKKDDKIDLAEVYSN